MLSSILGKSNLQFAGMSISLTISTASLNLRTPDSKQVHGCSDPLFPPTAPADECFAGVFLAALLSSHSICLCQIFTRVWTLATLKDHQENDKWNWLSLILLFISLEDNAWNHLFTCNVKNKQTKKMCVQSLFLMSLSLFFSFAPYLIGFIGYILFYYLWSGWHVMV